MLSLVAALGALVVPAFAGVSDPLLPDGPGQWIVVKVECAGGAEPDPNLFPEKGALYLTVFGKGNGIKTMIWSRWDDPTACWSVGPGLLLETLDRERVDVQFFDPGYVFAFDKLIST